MDPNRCGDVGTQIWVRVEHNLTEAGFNDIAEDSKIEIYKEAVHIYITELINTQKAKTSPGQSSSGTIGPTEKQKDMIKRLGGDPDTIKTKKAASDYIEKNKDW